MIKTNLQLFADEPHLIVVDGQLSNVGIRFLASLLIAKGIVFTTEQQITVLATSLWNSLNNSQKILFGNLFAISGETIGSVSEEIQIVLTNFVNTHNATTLNKIAKTFMVGNMRIVDGVLNAESIANDRVFYATGNTPYGHDTWSWHPSLGLDFDALGSAFNPYNTISEGLFYGINQQGYMQAGEFTNTYVVADSVVLQLNRASLELQIDYQIYWVMNGQTYPATTIVSLQNIPSGLVNLQADVPAFPSAMNIYSTLGNVIMKTYNDVTTIGGVGSNPNPTPGQTIKLKRGNKENLPASAHLGEPVFCKDTGELFIGTGTGLELAVATVTGVDGGEW